MTESFQHYLRVPSAILSDGLVTVPLYAVSSIGLSESYHLPPVGSSTARAIVATHDDSVTLSGVLVGPERFAWKLALEDMAESSKRGGLLATATRGRVGGLILVTSMTIRTDMQVQTVSFTASASRRDVLDVSLSLVHMPLPGALGKLLDASAVAVGALLDWTVR
jgi:phage protein U